MNVIIGIILFCVGMFLITWGLYEVGKKQKEKDDKLEDIERLRDNLTAIEVKRLDKFDAVNSFEDAI